MIDLKHHGLINVILTITITGIEKKILLLSPPSLAVAPLTDELADEKWRGSRSLARSPVGGGRGGEADDRGALLHPLLRPVDGGGGGVGVGSDGPDAVAQGQVVVASVKGAGEGRGRRAEGREGHFAMF